MSLASAFTDCELTSSEIAVISAGAQARHYAREAVIASESDCGIFFLVVSGHLVLKETRNGIEHVAGTASTGDVVCAEATAVADSDVHLMHLDERAVRSVIREQCRCQPLDATP